MEKTQMEMTQFVFILLIIYFLKGLYKILKFLNNVLLFVNVTAMLSL